MRGRDMIPTFSIKTVPAWAGDYSPSSGLRVPVPPPSITWV